MTFLIHLFYVSAADTILDYATYVKKKRFFQTFSAVLAQEWLLTRTSWLASYKARPPDSPDKDKCLTTLKSLGGTLLMT